ncbi:MAG: UDP-N-acetylmuramoyl-tripeptide--D-alanyl-D-alanine ligase [Chlamydiia bacterium]|nr:UDP-N-acetylmuramoyl-tripeptide--D-alanyl-D-alanine ligase [Chlamydiia bacterium]
MKLFLHQIIEALAIKEQLLNITGINTSRQLNTSIASYHFDSRDVEEEGLFFALKGKSFDGHDFLPDVWERGATCAIVDERYQKREGDRSLIYVKDVQSALQKLAQYVVEEMKPKVIGITGTCGKTTTKEFLSCLLTGHTDHYKSFSSANSQVAMPHSILNYYQGEKVMVLEMAMTEEGNIRNLVKIASPHFVVMTKVHYGHIAFFNSIEELVEAKCEIFSGKKVEDAVIHWDTFAYEGVKRHLPEKYATYGLVDGPDFSGRCEENRLIVDQVGTFELPFTESHFMENALAAIGAALKLGVSVEHIQSRVGELKSIPKRFEKFERDGVLFVNDAFNAIPLAVEMAFRNVPSPKKGGERIAVFGSMKELGEYTEMFHSQVGKLGMEVFDHFLCVGDECQTIVDLFAKENRSAQLFSDLDTLSVVLKRVMKEGDVVLVKGSKSHALWEVFDRI